MERQEPKQAGQTDSASWDGFWKTSAASGKASWSKKRICAVLQKYVRPGMDVLDAGSGSGFFSRWFLEQGCRVHSLDYSAQALASTRAVTEGRCSAYLSFDLTYNAATLPHVGKFGLIFSDGLFEHFGSGEQMVIFGNMAQMLAEGGVIVTFVPNRWTPWTIIRPFMMPGIHEKPFTRSALEKLYKDMGFTVEQSGGVNVLPVAGSPDSLLGGMFGMLVYCAGKKPAQGMPA